MKAQHQIARLEQLLERVRRNTSAPRIRVTSVTSAGERAVKTPPPPEPMELSDEDLIAVVSDEPPAPDASTEQAVASAATLVSQHSSSAPVVVEAKPQTESLGPASEPVSANVPAAPIAMKELPPVLSWPPERKHVEIEPTLRPPEPPPEPTAAVRPLPMSLVSDLPSESSWLPAAPEEPTSWRPSVPAADVQTEQAAKRSALPDAEPVLDDDASIEVPVLTPPAESGHQRLPDSPRVWATTPSQSPGKLELVEDEEEEAESESVPPSGPKATEAYSLPPGTEQFVQHVELEEDLGDDLELDELPEPPKVATTLMSPPSMPGDDLAEPGVQEAHVVEGLRVEVTRRPEAPSAAAPAAYAGIRQTFAPRTFLELLDASLKLGTQS